MKPIYVTSKELDNILDFAKDAREVVNGEEFSMMKQPIHHVIRTVRDIWEDMEAENYRTMMSCKH